MLDVFLGQVPLNAMGNTSSKQVFNVKTAVRPIIQIEFEAVILILSLLGRITDDNPDLNVYGDTRTVRTILAADLRQATLILK